MQAHDLSEHVHHEDELAHNRVGERRTRWVIAITAVMMFGELVVGWWTGSVALQADGWHMGSHVLALGLTLAAYWYARTRSRDKFSFGTGKVYALAGYTSGVLLVLVALWMAYEGCHNLITHPAVDYRDSLPVAALGFVVNLVSTALLSRGHHFGHGHAGHDHAGHGHAGHAHAGHDHAVHGGRATAHAAPQPGTLDFNLRAAYIHIFADAMTSLLAVAALALGWWAGLWYLDPLMGLIGGGVIVWWAVSLCRQAARQLLDVVSSPHHERIVRERLEAIDDVRVADLHVWELGPGRRSCIVSVVTARPREVSDYRDAVLSALDISHLTIEIHRCGLPHAAGRPAAESAHRDH